MTRTHFLKVNEVADKLGLTPPQVYRRIHDGRLAAVLGEADGKSCYLISPETVEQFIEAGPASHQVGQGAFIRPAEAGRLLGLSPEQVRRMVRDGRLPAQRNGARGQMRIRRSDVEAMIAGPSESVTA